MSEPTIPFRVFCTEDLRNCVQFRAEAFRNSIKTWMGKAETMNALTLLKQSFKIMKENKNLCK